LPTGTIVIQDVEKGGYIAEDDTVSNEMIVIDDFALFVTVRRSGDRETRNSMTFTVSKQKASTTAAPNTHTMMV